METKTNEWSEEHMLYLDEHYGKERAVDIAQKIGKTFWAVRGMAVRRGLTSNLRRIPGNATVQFMDKKMFSSNMKIGEIWTKLEEFQESTFQLSTHQDEATIKIDTDKPIAFVSLADLHIGAVSCRYKELRETVDYLSTLNNVFIGSIGDTVDNYLPSWHPEGQFSNIIPPEIQKILVEYLYDKLKGKFLFLVQGCHDNASYITDNFDWTKYLQQKFDCVNLGFGGFVNLIVGNQTYRICARHKYRYNSSLNLTHPVKRMREQFGDFDIGILAHNHQAVIEQLTHADKDRIYIRPGSFKKPDRFARQLGFLDTGSQMPSVILYPNKRIMLPFLNLCDGLEILNKLLEEK